VPWALARFTSLGLIKLRITFKSWNSTLSFFSSFSRPTRKGVVFELLDKTASLLFKISKSSPSCLEFAVVKEIPLLKSFIVSIYKPFDLSLAFSRLWNGLLGSICFRIVVASADWSPYNAEHNKITHHFQAMKFNGVHFFPISSLSRLTRRGDLFLSFLINSIPSF